MHPMKKLLLELNWLPTYLFYILLFSDIFSLLVKKLICAREPDFVNLPVFAQLKNCQLFKNAIYDPKMAPMDKGE